MPKKSLVNWFVRNIILPRYKDYKSPGFISINFKSSGKEVFLRQILFPEDIIINLEDELSKINQVNLLYNIGVTLGYNFAKLFNVPSIGKNTKSELEKYAKFTFKWNFSTWCKDASIDEFDLDHKKLTLTFNDLIVCRINGKGYIITEGSQSGFAKFMLSDPNMEVVQTDCQGRKCDHCTTIWRTKSFFKENNIIHHDGQVLFDIPETLLEKKINQIKPPKYSNKSAYNMITNKIFTLKEGQIKYKSFVFFDCTIILYYLIESLISSISGGKEILFNIGFNYGKKLTAGKTVRFIPDILSALGWGDQLITKHGSKTVVYISHFPYSSLFNDKLEFNLFKGLISGMLSSALKKEIIINKIEIKKSNDNLVLIFFEN